MKIKSIRDVKNLKGKRVLLRADFNVPIEKGKIKEDYKIAAGLPTIRFLLRYGCKIIIATHLGEPKGKKVKELSTKPIADRLSKLLGEKVKFVEDTVGIKAGNAVNSMKNKEIVMLENLRFSYDEKNNDIKFAKELAKLADIYVNDAFAVSHRNHASLSAIKKYLKPYAGILLENEIKNLEKALNPKEPLILVIGGAKISTKIKLIKKFNKIAHRILIGGALANNFFAAHKLEVGKSLVDKNNIKVAKEYIKKYKNIILPIDIVVSSGKDGDGKPVIRNAYNIKKNETILDIGPDTIRFYSSFIKKAATIIWNGPMGVFEKDRFKHGTFSIARVIAARSGGETFGVVGGGETIEALRKTKMLEYVDWPSTGGGAMLSYLSGDKMPGLKKIYGK
ncbi:MAG: phosphoglycerate kinase [Candidatus Falkowbacteria bacterium]